MEIYPHWKENHTEIFKLTFPNKLKGADGIRFFALDIKANNSVNFKLLKQAELTLDGFMLNKEDEGGPTPRNLIKVSVNHLPQDVSDFRAGLLFAEALKKAYPACKVHDVFMLAVPSTKPDGSIAYQTNGAMCASVQFTQMKDTETPDDIVGHYFPGFINIRRSELQISYFGRIDHCLRCKSRANPMHTQADCPKVRSNSNPKCFNCNSFGHIAINCTVRSQATRPETTDTSPTDTPQETLLSNNNDPHTNPVNNERTEDQATDRTGEETVTEILRPDPPEARSAEQIPVQENGPEVAPVYDAGTSTERRRNLPTEPNNGIPMSTPFTGRNTPSQNSESSSDPNEELPVVAAHGASHYSQQVRDSNPEDTPGSTRGKRPPRGGGSASKRQRQL